MPLAQVSEAQRPAFAEFFAGIGLARHGLERTGWEVKFANDINARKKEMYEAHFGPAPYYSTDDVHSLADNPTQIPDVALAHASFPCTDLSVAGRQKGLSAGQSSAFWGFHQLLKNQGSRRPPLVLLENVTGFLTSRRGEDFAAAMRAMNEIGYSVDPFIIDAEPFVPQSRPRLFVVGVRQDSWLGLISHGCEPPVSDCRPAKLCQVVASLTDIDWRPRPLPPLPSQSVKLQDVVDSPDDPTDCWSADRAEYLINQMSKRHRQIADRMIAGDSWSYGTVFRRMRKGADGKKRSMAELRTDGVAGCLRASSAGSSKQILFKAGQGKYWARYLSPRECAALMGAPDFKVTAREGQALEALGDGVCADVIDWIARNYLNPVWGVIQDRIGVWNDFAPRTPAIAPGRAEPPQAAGAELGLNE